MKKMGLLCVFLSLCCFTTPAFSDEAPGRDYHSMEYSVRIVNADDYPDYVLTGWICSHLPTSPYIIHSNTFLEKGYKLNNFKILAFTKKRFDEMGGLAGLKKMGNLSKTPGSCGMLREDDGVFVSNIEIDPGNHHVSNDNPVWITEEEYSIAGFSDGKVHMYLSKRRTVTFNPQEKTEVFKKPSP